MIESATEPTVEPAPPSLIDRLALAAYAADEAAEAERDAEAAAAVEEKYLPHWQEEALAFVRSSPLAGYFPIPWRLVDHNLPAARLNGTSEQVVVTADDEDQQGPPLRFVVTCEHGPLTPTWGVAIAGPLDMTGGDWMTFAQPVSSRGDVGRWVAVNRPHA